LALPPDERKPLYADTIHPNTAGLAFLGNEVFKAIASGIPAPTR